MISVQHDGSISGGKDSQAVACLMVERAHAKGFGPRPPRFFSCDTGHENPITLDHIGYLSEWLLCETGQPIRMLSGYDVPGLIDEAAFERQRGVIRTEWPKEKRVKRHSKACNLLRATDLKAAMGCDCPVRHSLPVPDDLIEAAIAALVPTGIAFLDMAMLHGRFPGAKTRFCTDELKLAPLMLQKRPLLDEGVHVIDWVGERKDESKARAEKGAFTRIRHERAVNVLFRPVFDLTARDVFEISKRHGLKPNPLYLMGAGRVGCSPCIMVKKRELAQWAMRFPDEVARVREWERIVGLVSRRLAGMNLSTSLLAAKTVSGPKDDEFRALIDRAVVWAQTTRGGRQSDLLLEIQRLEFDAEGAACDSAYGLCE